ncbi:MAG: T9SS type A sorting domain-containing protein [Flammeovirgaceae bacterium]|nr:T9SS type A sorting domain-containing protein [Flammeovirgaceae bacterium]
MKKINPKIFSFSCLFCLGFFLNLSAQERFTLKGEINGEDIDGKTEARVIVCDNFSAINLLNHVSYGNEQTISYKAETNALANHFFYPSLAGHGNHLITIINGQQTVDLTFEIPEISAGLFIGICRNKKSLELYKEEVYPKNDGKGKWSFFEENEKGDSEYDKYINQTTGIIDVSQIPFGFYTLKYEYGSCYDTRGIEITGADVFAGGDITVCQGFRGLSLNTYNNGTETPTINQEPIPSESNFKIEWIPKDKIIAENLNDDFISLLNIPAGTYDIDLVVTIIGETTNCEERDTRTLIVESIPEQPSVQGGSRCGPGKVILEAKGSEGATKFNWYTGIEDKEPLPNNDEGQIGKTFTTSELQSTTSYYIEAVYGETCISERQEVKAYILEQPVSPKLISSVGTCGLGGKVAISTEKVDRVKNRWFLLENFELDKPIHTGFDYNPEITQTTNYYVVAVIIHKIEDKEILCYSEPTKVTGTVYPKPSNPKVSQDKFEICEKGTVKFTASGLEGGIYNWYWDNNKENIAAEGKSEFSFEFTISSNKKLYVEVIDPETKCVSNLTEVAVFVTQNPETPNIEDISICGSGIVLLKPLVSEEEMEPVFRFYLGEDSKYIFEGSEYGPEIKETTSFLITRIIGETCESDPKKITITILDEVPTPIVDGFVNCGPLGSYKLEIQNPVEGLSYLWYANEKDSKEIGQGPSLLVENINDTKVFWVEASNNNDCVGERIPVEVTILKKPDAPEVADGISCGPGKVTLSIKNPDDNLIYKWFKSLEDETPLSTGTSYSTEEITTNTKFYVIAYSYFGEREIECLSESTEVEVQILESGEIGIGEDLQLCYDAPVYDLFQDLNIEGGAFSGSGVENGNQFNPKTTGFGKYEISFKYKSNDGCSFIGTRIIEVIYPLNASEDLLTKTELVICSNEEFIELMELEKKPGGEWSGDGVENGKFYPNKSGEGSGSVEYFLKENGCEYRTKVTIRVIDVNLESPELSINKPLFCEGNIVKISVTNLNESLRYVWFNENSDSVGTGSSYEFTASATTTITCESKNPLDCGSDQSSIIVNVFSFPEEIVVSSNSISQHEFIQFSLDSTGNTTYLWDFKTAETSTQRSPGYYFHEGGEFNVVVYMENSFLGCEDSLTTIIKVDLDQDDFVTGLEEEIPTDKSDGFSITSYPQPFNNFIKLFFRSEKPIDAEVAIFSTDGKLIENKKLKLLKGEQDVDWETKKYPSGLYLIKINLPGSQKVIKALKQ